MADPIVTDKDIKWQPKPVHTRDADSPLYLELLTRDELLVWALGAQEDIEAASFTLKQALTALHDVMVERDALRQALRRGRA
jgi:hypothetical protein